MNMEMTWPNSGNLSVNLVYRRFVWTDAHTAPSMRAAIQPAIWDTVEMLLKLRTVLDLCGSV